MIFFIEIYPNIVKRGNSCCLFGLKEKTSLRPIRCMTQHPQGRIGGKMDEANKSAFPFYTLLPQKEEAAFDF